MTDKPKNPGRFQPGTGRASEAGRKGGMKSKGGGGAPNNPGNFANRREAARIAGKKGGRAPRRPEGKA